MEVRERILSSSHRNAAQPDFSAHLATACKFASQRFLVAERPPMDSTHFRESRQSSTQSMEGVLMVSALKMPSMNLPPLVMRKIFGKGRLAGLKDSRRSTARGESTI